METADDQRAAFVDPLEPTIGFQLRRASAALATSLAHALEPIGLRPSEASLLMLIGANPGCTQSEIGRALRVQPANLVALVNGLAAAGALERTPGRGRAVALSLSPAGRALHRRVGQVLAEREARIAAVVPEALRGGIVTLLRAITQAACRDRHGVSPDGARPMQAPATRRPRRPHGSGDEAA